jgi:hypothetical protein
MKIRAASGLEGERRDLVIGEVRDEKPTAVELAWEVGSVEHRSEVLTGVT